MGNTADVGGRRLPNLTSLGAVAVMAMVAAGGIVRMNQEEKAEDHLSEQCGPTRPREIPEVIRIDPLGQLPGNHTIIARVKFPPGACAGVHTHGGTVSVYVISGMVRSQLEGEPAQIYGPGQSFFEPPGAVHLIAENVSDVTPAEIIAFHVLGEHEQVTVFGQ